MKTLSPPVACWALFIAVMVTLWPNNPPSFAEDWPQWRGPGRDGVWNPTNVLQTLPPGKIPESWSVAIGPGYNGPTVAEGRVFVMDRDAERKNQTERILCLNEQDGKLLWEYRYPAEYRIGYTAGPRASVTIDSNRVYAVGAMGHFHCLETATGKVLWQRDLNSDYSIKMPIWGIAASPLVYGDLVIQQVAGEGNACFVAFDKTTGKEAWRALDEIAGYASPIIVKQAGRDVLICWTGESLSGLNPASGKVFWSLPMKPSRMPIGIGTPVINANRVFVSSFYDGSLLARLSDKDLTAQVGWRAVGKSERKTTALHAMIGTCILDGDYVYGADSYGEFRCLDARTGKRIWEDLNAVPKARWATIHMVKQADRVWMFNERGELMITKLSPNGLAILSRSQLIEPTRTQLNQRDGVCWSHPAFANGAVYVRNDKRILKASLVEN